jgi:hypothetical protein
MTRADIGGGLTKKYNFVAKHVRQIFVSAQNHHAPNKGDG